MEVQKLQRDQHDTVETKMKKMKWMERRAGEVEDEMDAPQKQKEQFGEQITKGNDDILSEPESFMAVLKECHALTFE